MTVHWTGSGDNGRWFGGPVESTASQSDTSPSVMLQWSDVELAAVEQPNPSTRAFVVVETPAAVVVSTCVSDVSRAAVPALRAAR